MWAGCIIALMGCLAIAADASATDADDGLSLLTPGGWADGVGGLGGKVGGVGGLHVAHLCRVSPVFSSFLLPHRQQA